MWQLFIVIFFLYWWEIQFDPFWTDLIQTKIKNITGIFILSVNVTTFYSNIFRLARKSSLIKFDQVWSSLIKFDPFWTDLIQKNKNKTDIFILFKNVTTFYSNIFRLVRKSSLIKFDPFWADLIKKKSKIKQSFLSFM